MMEKKIWVYIEHHNGKVEPVSLELLSKATDIAGGYKDGASVEAVILGDDLQDALAELATSGANSIYAIENKCLKEYSPWTYVPVITQVVTKHKPDLFLFGATAMGNVVGPSVAARLKTGMAAHCIDLHINPQEQMVANVPAFGGKVISEILCPDNLPQMASTKPGIFEKKSFDQHEVKVIKEDISEVLEQIDLSKLKHITDVEVTPEGVGLNKAELVICGGFGVAVEKDWKHIRNLAQKLGAAVACTRPVVDSGLAKENQMIGTSGCSVKPKVYLGFGVSGATHHVCGMNTTGYVITVNRDKAANIFKYSDLCIVDDADKILASLDEAVK